MKRSIKNFVAVILTGLLALQPLSFAGPLIVMADEILYDEGTYNYEPDGCTEYSWKIYKDKDEYRLVVSGAGDFDMNSLKTKEEGGDYYLYDTVGNRNSTIALSQISVFEINGMTSFYDESFTDTKYGVNKKLKKIKIDDDLDYIYHNYKLEALQEIDIDGENSSLSMDGNAVILNDDGLSLLLYIPNGENEYTVPENITSIASNAFYFVDSLTSVSLPSSLETIEQSAFQGCNNIKKMHIPASVTLLGMYPDLTIDDVSAFTDMESLEEITVDPNNPIYSAKDGVLFSKDGTTLCFYPPNKKTDKDIYIIPSSVKKISMYAFIGENTKYIFVPNTVEHIYYYPKTLYSLAFYGAKGQVLYEGTENEWKKLFDDNSKVYNNTNFPFPKITFITPGPDVTDKSLKEGMCKNYSWKITGSAGNYTLTVTGKAETDEYVEVFYPVFEPFQSEKEKVYYLFDVITGKFSIVSLDKISHVEFNDINTVILECFAGEDGINNNTLESISIPKTLDELNNLCCLNKLKTITVERGNQNHYLKDGVLFSNDMDNGKSIQLYPATLTDTSFTVPDGIRHISNFAFAGNTSLTSIKLNEVSIIDDKAFYGCTGLTEIDLPSTFEPYDGDSAFSRVDSFRGMPSLQKISVSDKNKYYSSVDGVLYSKDGKTLCFYPAARKADNNCYRIPSNVETLGFYAFYGAQLDSVFIPKSVKEIEHETYDDGSCWYELFYGSTIKNIYYEGTKEEWDKLWDSEKCDPDCKLPEIEYNSNGPAPNVISVSDNLPMDYSTEERGDYKFSYNHSIPFFGKAKPQLAFFGEEGIKVLCNNEEYLASKVKINKNKKLITVTGLKKADGSDAEKDLVKKVKKATKGKNGLSFNINTYYIKDDTKLEPKKGKDGSLKSIKIEIKEKLYKARKKEFTYDKDSDTVTFDSENLKGSRKLS